MKRWSIVGIALIAVGAALFAIDEYWPSHFAEAVPRADSVRVSKSNRTLELLAAGRAVKSYPISLGGSPVGPKRMNGDSKTPEGTYTIEWRKPNSRFYRALRISYPNETDRAGAMKRAESPGGDIMIHGVPRGLGIFGLFFRGRDWTNGCIAVDDVAMAEIWSAVEVGTPIEIRP
jgi:murein L,D-transpeptidase YafK